MKIAGTFKSLIRVIPVLLLATITFFSCKTKNPDKEIKTINVLEPDGKQLNISEIADDIKYIPLANDSILRGIFYIDYADGEYFISDIRKFLRFNEKGEFLNKIGTRGSGPGEYQYASDFVIEPDTREIFITGGKRDQIMVYSPEGKFIRSFGLPGKSLSSIGMDGKNVFVFYLSAYEHDTVNMQLLDSRGTLLKSYTNKYKFERGRAVVGYRGECLMYSLQNKLHFKEIFSDTIFYLDRQKMVPEMILNSGDKRFTPEIRSQIIKEIGDNPRNTPKIQGMSLTQNNLFETNNYLFYSYNCDRKGRMLIYNKSTGRQIEIDSKTGIKNDWDGGPNIQLKKNKDDNTVFSWMNAFELKTYVASDDFKNATPKYPEKKKALEEMANSLDENDNPVLMLVKLKE